MKKKGYSRNIILEYVYSLLSNFNMSNYIWVLYLAFKGLDLAQVGILESIYHITSVLCEIPSGAAADLLGRKWTIIAGRVCIAISCLIMLLAKAFPAFAISFVIQALGNNLNSGSEEALLYDSMKQCGKEKQYLKVNGNVNIIIEISQALAAMAGGILSEQSFYWCYIAACVVAFLSLVPVIFMIEPQIRDKYLRSREKQERKVVREHFHICVEILGKNKRIRDILLFYATIFAVYTTFYFYSQQYFYNIGYQKIQISLIMLLAGGASCLGAGTSNFIYGKLGERGVSLAAFFIGVGFLGTIIPNRILTILFFLVASYANAFLYPVQSIKLNEQIPSRQRATIISVSSMLLSVVMAVIFPIVGSLAQQFGLENILAVLGVLLIVGITLRKWFQKDEKK